MRCLSIACFLISVLLVLERGYTKGFKYPPTRRGDQIDEYHGTKVADPYRWLEDDVRESTEVADWVTAQNNVTFGYLKKLSERDAIEARLTELWNFAKYSSPAKHGDTYFFYKNDGLQNQYVLYRQDTLDSEPTVLLDPNSWSKDGTVALSGTSFTESGKLLAYGIAEAGSDWNTWRVIDVDSGKLLEDEIKWVKFSGISWSKDQTGFYYASFPKPDEGEAFQSLNLNHTLYYHRLGTEQDEDQIVYRRSDSPEWMFSGEVTEDGRYLVIEVSKGTDDKNRVLYRDLSGSQSEIVEVIDHFDDEYSFVGNDGETFYFKTDLDAPKGRLIAIDNNDPDTSNWREVIPAGDNVLRNVSYVGGHFLAQYLVDAKTQVKVYRAHA